MNVYSLFVFFSYTILIAAVVGFLRYTKVPSGYRPFFFIVWIALINEILSEVMTAVTKSNAVNCNIYVLIEALLYCHLFYNWSSIRKKEYLKSLLAFIVLVWVTDNLILNSISHTNSLFRIVSSFILVFLAIDQINLLIISERSRLITNPRFLISIGMVIFFPYRAFIEVFYLMKLPFSTAFYIYVWEIMDFVNLFVNLIFALAALWIPTRQKFILPS